MLTEKPEKMHKQNDIEITIHLYRDIYREDRWSSASSLERFSLSSSPAEEPERVVAESQVDGAMQGCVVRLV